MDTTAARARAKGIIRNVLPGTAGLYVDLILDALDEAGLDVIERVGTVCLPVADMKHLHENMAINSSHDSALWYRVRDLITAATAKRTRAKKDTESS